MMHDKAKKLLVRSGSTLSVDVISVKLVGGRGIYALEYQLFQNRFWVAVYVAFACVFKSNASLGWQKVIPVLGIPKGRLTMVCALAFSSLSE